MTKREFEAIRELHCYLGTWVEDFGPGDRETELYDEIEAMLERKHRQLLSEISTQEER